MKILFLSRLYYPHIGGVEKHVYEVGKLLAQNGFDITIITEKYDNHLKNKELFDGMKIIRANFGVDDWFKKFRIWSWMWKNRSLIKETDLVHAHDVYFWYAPFRFIYFFKKSYITFHGFEGAYPISFRSKIIRKISEKISDGNIIVGDFIKKWYGTKSEFVTYGGVNTNIKNQILKIKHPKKVKILFIGRLESDTGLPVFLNALDYLGKKGIDFEFKAAGDGILRKQASKLGNVLGFTKNISKYIYEADIILCSSYLSILESLIFRKNIISVYDNPLKKDYLMLSPMSEYVFIENNYKSVVDKILFITKNKKINNDGYIWARKQSWENVVGLYIKLWKT